MNEPMLTIKETCRRLRIPSSTYHTYPKRYPRWVYCEDDGRRVPLSEIERWEAERQRAREQEKEARRQRRAEAWSRYVARVGNRHLSIDP
jgi:hypothetical protein